MDDLKTPTDALIKAMEKADEMQEVIILYRIKGETGVGWCTSVSGLGNKLALLEEGKFGLIAYAYNIDPQP